MLDGVIIILIELNEATDSSCLEGRLEKFKFSIA